MKVIKFKNWTAYVQSKMKVVRLVAKPKSSRRGPSRLEEGFTRAWARMCDLPLETEYKFHPTRKWRFDFAHLTSKVAIEVEGGIWSQGRHTRGSGYMADCKKYNAAIIEGWRVFRITSIDPVELQQIINYINQHKYT